MAVSSYVNNDSGSDTLIKNMRNDLFSKIVIGNYFTFIRNDSTFNVTIFPGKI